MNINKENSMEVMKLAAELAGENNLAGSISSRLNIENTSDEVAAIDRGISRYDAAFTRAMEDGASPVVTSELDEALAEKSEEEKKSSYSELIRVLGGDPERLSAEGLRLTAIEFINDFAVTQLDMNAGMEEALERLEKEEKITEGFELTGDSRRYIAASIYILQKQGKLPELAKELDVEAIGVFTAASEAAQRHMRECAGGKIPWDKVLKVLKVIAAVAAVIVIAIVIYKVSMIVAFELFFLLPLLFGSFALLHGLVAFGMVCFAAGLIANAIKIAEKVKELITPGIEVLKELWSKLVTWIKETVYPALVVFWETVKEEARKLSEAVEDTAGCEVETELEEEPEVEEEEELVTQNVVLV